MMIFTIRTPKGTQTYEGFKSCKTLEVPEGCVLAGIQNEDTIDWWWVKKTTIAMEELERFYRSEHPELDIKFKFFDRIPSALEKKVTK